MTTDHAPDAPDAAGTAAALAAVKQFNRTMWAAGDFPAVAKRTLWPVGERVVQAIGVGVGEDVLDVACGTGNAAIRAAAAGGRVVGLDLTPELFEAGRREAADAGVEIDWREGDAEALPFPEASFDVVLSVFGVMFAPRHAVAAAELVRVLRPGGRIGLCAWTPEGMQGDFFRVLGDYLPPGPAFAQPPLAWGDEAHVRELFAGSGLSLEFERETVPGQPFASGEDALDWTADNFGPLMLLRPRLEADGVWDRLRANLLAVYERGDAPEYLLVRGRKL